MKSLLKHLVLSMALFAVASTTQALTISANTSAYASSVIWPYSTSNDDADTSSGGRVNAYSERWSDPSWWGRNRSAYAEASATADIGGGSITTSGWGAVHSARANIGWSESYLNSGTVAEALYLDFMVGDGELELYDRSGVAADRLSASYWIDILVDGSSIWSSSVVLFRGASGSMTRVNETGASFGGLLSSDSNWLTYQWVASPLITLNLGVLAPGEALTLDFRMGVHTEGGGNLCFDTSYRFACTAVSSNASFSLMAGPTLYASPLASVPEPGTFLLLGGGTLALGVLAARRRRVM